MGFFANLRSWRRAPSPREIASLIKTIVDRCEPTVWESVNARAILMGPAEARGYIRARAAAVVGNQVELALRSHANWHAAAQTMVLEATTDGIVRQIHHRLLNARRPAAQRRLAA